MIMQPDFIDQPMVAKAKQELQKKKNLSALQDVRFEKFHERKAAQLLHVGPFSEEGPSVARLHDFIQANGALSGKHHEIYLSDIRKADPSKWKTIIRQPMR